MRENTETLFIGSSSTDSKFSGKKKFISLDPSTKAKPLSGVFGDI